MQQCSKQQAAKYVHEKRDQIQDNDGSQVHPPECNLVKELVSDETGGSTVRQQHWHRDQRVRPLCPGYRHLTAFLLFCPPACIAWMRGVRQDKTATCTTSHPHGGFATTHHQQIAPINGVPRRGAEACTDDSSSRMMPGTQPVRDGHHGQHVQPQKEP